MDTNAALEHLQCIGAFIRAKVAPDHVMVKRYEAVLEHFSHPQLNPGQHPQEAERQYCRGYAEGKAAAHQPISALAAAEAMKEAAANMAHDNWQSDLAEDIRALSADDVLKGVKP